MIEAQREQADATKQAQLATRYGQAVKDRTLAEAELMDVWRRLADLDEAHHEQAETLAGVESQALAAEAAECEERFHRLRQAAKDALMSSILCRDEIQGISVWDGRKGMGPVATVIALKAVNAVRLKEDSNLPAQLAKRDAVRERITGRGKHPRTEVTCIGCGGAVSEELAAEMEGMGAVDVPRCRCT